MKVSARRILVASVAALAVLLSMQAALFDRLGVVLPKRPAPAQPACRGLPRVLQSPFAKRRTSGGISSILPVFRRPSLRRVGLHRLKQTTTRQLRLPVPALSLRRPVGKARRAP